MTRLLRSTPITGLHHYYEPVRQPDPQRYSHPRYTRATPSHPPENPNGQCRIRPSPVPCKSRRPGSRRLHAGHRLANQRAPARLLPGSSLHPGFDVIYVVSTRQQRIACARLPDPHLTRHARLFHIAHHDRVTAPAACGGLKPPPAGRLRRADNPSSPAQHRFTKLYLHQAPFHVRDTPTNRCPSSSTPCADTPTPAPTPNLPVPPHRVHSGSSPKFHATRDMLRRTVYVTSTRREDWGRLRAGRAPPRAG